MKNRNLKISSTAKVYESFEQWEKETLPNKVKLEDLSFSDGSKSEILESKKNISDTTNQLMLII